MNAKPPLKVLMLLIFALFLASSLPYRHFTDADYASAWWSLAWLLGSPLSVESELTTRSALLTVFLSSLLVGSIVVLCVAGRVWRRFVLGSLAALCWMSSPWQAGALQSLGLNVLLLLVPVLMAACLTFVLPIERKLLVVTTTILFIGIFLSAVFLESPFLHPGLIVLPPPSVLGPWRSPDTLDTSVSLYLLLALILTVICALERITRRSEFSFAPLCLLLLLIPGFNVLILAEQIQIRANPRLSLLYSLSYPTPSAAELWLASEYFDMLGGQDIADAYRERARDEGNAALPASFRLPLRCIRGEQLAARTVLDASARKLYDYLRRHARCQ